MRPCPKPHWRFAHGRTEERLPAAARPETRRAEVVSWRQHNPRATGPPTRAFIYFGPSKPLARRISLAVPGLAVPAEHALDERRYVVREDPEERFAFFGEARWGSPMWPGIAAFARDPAAGGGGEGRRRSRRAERCDRSPTRCGARRSIIEVSHSQAWPISRLRERRVGFLRLAAERPVGGEEQQQVVALPVALAQSRRRPAGRARCCRRGR